jgi:hypothetical protein
MVIVEYCKYGNLSNYLKSKRDLFCLNKVRIHPGPSLWLWLMGPDKGPSLREVRVGTQARTTEEHCLLPQLPWLA